MVDEDAVKEFIEDVGPESAQSLIMLFAAEARSRCLRVRELVARAHWKDVQREAHALRSTCGTYGIPGLAEIAGELEAAAEAGDGDRAAEMAAAIDESAEGAIDNLLNLIDSLT